MSKLVINAKDCITSRLKDEPAPEWSAVVLCFRDKNASNILLSELGAVPCRKYMYGAEEQQYEMTVSGKKVGVVTRCHWGGPQAAILTEEAANFKVKLILGIGACGSLNPGLPKGSLVAATRALNTDGTTKAFTDEKLVKPIPFMPEETYDEYGLKPAAAATVDALYRETYEQLHGFGRAGADIVNMETSPMYACANAYDLPALWMGCVSDCVKKDEWEDWSNIEDMTAETGKVAKKILTNILLS